MEQAAAIIGISGILILLVNIANQKTSHFGSDHYFHLNLIRLIQQNQHRFVKKYQNFIDNNYIAYPQLFHWILSFLNAPIWQASFIV
jgi:asparagine N-glycosylation enzyme membrane subunit Stt3